jgi:hypothetical protein
MAPGAEAVYKLGSDGGDAMSRFSATVGLAAAGLALMLVSDAALAGKGGRDPTFVWRHADSFSIQRYPGDQAFEGGTVRFQNPDKGPYIERCSWTIGNVFDGPVNLTQRCYRHTLENTPE